MRARSVPGFGDEIRVIGFSGLVCGGVAGPERVLAGERTERGAGGGSGGEIDGWKVAEDEVG